ncbi:hypothetical protein ALC56_05204, partial [Trachymyrmex septentrionalis]
RMEEGAGGRERGGRVREEKTRRWRTSDTSLENEEEREIGSRTTVKCQEFEEKREVEAPKECTLRSRKEQYRDKVERITYWVASVHTEKENGKCHVAADRASVRARSWDERETEGAEKNKKTRVYVRGKPGEVSGAADATERSSVIRKMYFAKDGERERCGRSIVLRHYCQVLLPLHSDAI